MLDSVQNISIVSLDGSDMSYARCLWSPSSPDISSCNDCYCSYLGPDGFLKQSNCNKKHGYVCEYKGTACPKGMALFENKCYWIVRNPDAELVSKMPTEIGSDVNVNCRWKSGDPRHYLASIKTKVSSVATFKKILQQQFFSTVPI